MKPLAGVEKLGYFTSRFEADAVVARLDAHGIRASVIGDPAAGIAPHLVTSAGYQITVSSADAEGALALLGDAAESSSSAPVSRRTRGQRVVAWALAATFFVPSIIAAVKTLLDAL